MIRRSFLRMFGGAAVFSPLILVGVPGNRPFAAEQEGEPVRFRWRVPVVHKRTVEGSLRYEGEIEREKDKKGALVFVFVGAVLLPFLAEAILELRRDIIYGGVVIDTRGAEIVIENDKRLDSRTIVVVGPEGNEIYEREEIANPSELVAALMKGS